MKTVKVPISVNLFRYGKLGLLATVGGKSLAHSDNPKIWEKTTHRKDDKASKGEEKAIICVNKTRAGWSQREVVQYAKPSVADWMLYPNQEPFT